MEAQYEEISRWSKWCLEYTGALLRGKFPQHAVWVVRPSRVLRLLFSCFDNFVDSSLTGVPTYSSSYGTVQHLELLLRDSIQQAHASGALTLDPPQSLSLPIVLAGFSKGCVVLNQILHELATTPAREFVSQLREWYWLDGGHSGQGGVYVTADEVLAEFASLRPRVFVHVTPQQVCDTHRPWIAEEEREFVDKLSSLGVAVQEKLHFENAERSLERHFEVLETF